MAKPKLTCRLAKIQLIADGITTERVSCQSRGAEDPRIGDHGAVGLAHALEGVGEDDEEHHDEGQRDLRGHAEAERP